MRIIVKISRYQFTITLISSAGKFAISSVAAFFQIALVLCLTKHSRQKKERKKEKRKKRTCCAATLKLASPGWALFSSRADRLPWPDGRVSDNGCTVQRMTWSKETEAKQRKFAEWRIHTGPASTFVLRLLSNDRDPQEPNPSRPTLRIRSCIVLVRRPSLFLARRERRSVCSAAWSPGDFLDTHRCNTVR